MYDFTLSLAGIPIGISAVYPSTMRFCRDYFTDEPPVFSIELTRESIENERSYSLRQGGPSDDPFLCNSGPHLEHLALYREIARRLIDYDAIVFHGSAVAVDGRVFLFTAPSGTGKTTHTRLWLDQIPGSYVLNGDKPLLRFCSDRILVCGTPWRGRERLGCNEILPLHAVCLLERSKENTITEITISEAFEPLMRQTFQPENQLLKTLDLVGKFGMTHLYRLGCNMEHDAAWVSFHGMTKDTI